VREPDEPAQPADIPSKLEHDLVNSLASIVGFSQVIRRDASLPDELRRNAELLAEEAARTRQMVGELLGLLRQRPAGLPGPAQVPGDPPLEASTSSAAATGSTAAVVEDADTPSSAPASRPSVLVLEDEPSMRVFLEKALALLGYDPVIASLAADAVPLATSGDHAVLLFDHQMAGMSGIDAVTAILAQRPDLAKRVALMTGDVEDPRLEAYTVEHQVAILAKPFDLDTLDRTIRAVMAATGQSRG
jgi:CheY-like chemotaxis protein